MLGWAAGFVRAGVVWVLPVGEDGDEGLRHPGEVFDGLVAGSWAMSVVQTTASGSEQRDGRGR